jgi:hypothetical protein
MFVLSGGAFANQMLVHATWAKFAREKRGERGLDAHQGKALKKNTFTHWLFSAPAIPSAVELVFIPEMEMDGGDFLLDFYQILLFYSAAYESLWGETEEFA